MVENIVAIEQAYINTKHPDFYPDAASIGSMLKSPELESESKLVSLRISQISAIPITRVMFKATVVKLLNFVKIKFSSFCDLRIGSYGL